MSSNTKKIIDLVLGCGRFSHVFVENGLVFVANEIDLMTACCAPTVRESAGLSRIDYDLVLVIVGDRGNPLVNLRSSVADGRYVALLKAVGTRHSLDMLVHNGRLSDWLVAEMVLDLQKYTRNQCGALDLIRNGDDKFIEKLKRVFGDKFVERIESPLTRLN